MIDRNTQELPFSTVNVDLNSIIDSIKNTITDFKRKNIPEDTFTKLLSGYALNFLYFFSKNSNTEYESHTQDVTVKIVHHHEEHEPFFGVRCFPTTSICIHELFYGLQNYVTDGMDKDQPKLCITNSANFFLREQLVLEIDSMVFDPYLINLNPSEITAYFMNAIFNTTSKEAFYVILDKIASKSLVPSFRNIFKAKSNDAFISIIFLSYLSYFCAISTPVLSSEGKINEYGFYLSNNMEKFNQVDSFVSASKKVLNTFGTRSFCTKLSLEHVDHEITEYFRYITDFYKRRNQLKDRIALNIMRTSSETIRFLNRHTLEKLSVKLKEVYSGVVMESINTDYIADKKVYPTKYVLEYDEFTSRFKNILNVQDSKSIAMESFIRKSKKSRKPLLPSDHDIDIIFVEYDKMNCQSDRAYVLDLIYEQINKINNTLDYYRETDQGRYEIMAHTASSQLDRLAELRKMVLQKRNFNKRYTVFIKSPEGYEG